MEKTKMSKQLEKLTEKALRTGFANLNGRYYIYYQGYSELESKWQVQYDNETGELEIYHWGTKILKLGSLKASKPIVKEFYGQSRSDRDALAFMFRYFGLPYGASYRPSVDTFSVFADFGTGTEEWKTV